MFKGSSCFSWSTVGMKIPGRWDPWDTTNSPRSKVSFTSIRLATAFCCTTSSSSYYSLSINSTSIYSRSWLNFGLQLLPCQAVFRTSVCCPPTSQNRRERCRHFKAKRKINHPFATTRHLSPVHPILQTTLHLILQHGASMHLINTTKYLHILLVV